MIYFIKKLFANNIDEQVHEQFVKFSRGVFENKAVLNISRTTKIKISSTYELATDLALFMAYLAKNVHVSGIVMSREQIPEFSGSKKRGLWMYDVNQSISFDRLNDISKKSFAMLLDCEAPGISLKVKKKLPRPSSKSLDKVKDKFCTAQIDLKFWPAVKEEFLSDLPDGKAYKVINKYEITELVLPENEKDSERLRLLTKRKGKLIRKSIVDGKEIIHEKSFAA